jgi:hypothetical protein
MKEQHEQIKLIEKKIEGSIKFPYQAATIAFELFYLRIQDTKTNLKLESLLKKFLEKLSTLGLDNLHIIQADYAIRISNYGGKLEYEEMHKLFSLCDEIHAMDYLGLKLDQNKKRELEESLRSTFLRDKKNANIAAHQNVELWNKNLWWYVENLK